MIEKEFIKLREIYNESAKGPSKQKIFSNIFFDSVLKVSERIL